MSRHSWVLACFILVLTIPSSPFFLSVSTTVPAATALTSSSTVSWNPRITCTPLVVRITDITANQTGSASLTSSQFSPGITTTVSGGSAKRWLTPGATPPGWVSPGPPCTVTNTKGTTSLFVEIDGVERGSVTAEDSSASYDPTNGGTAHSTTYDNTFNVFDPSIVSNYDASCTSPTDRTCYGRIHAEIDHDWLAAGYCGLGTFCDPSALTSQTNRASTKIDIQGFVFWDPGNLDGAYHQYNGWELHPLTAWKLSSSPPPPSSMSVSFAASPPVPQVGQNVIFNTSVTGGTPPFTFGWDFGDGVAASGSTVSHMYLAPNEFTVKVTAIDAQGNSASAQKALDVGSWNPAVACVPAQTTLEGVVGNVSIQRLAADPNSTGADYSGGGFRLDGNLSYGSNPTIWPYFKRDLHPSCNVNGTPAFVEFHNVTVVDRAIDDCSTTFFSDNGGGSYPNGWQSCDITFNLVTPGFGDSSTCPQCYMHRVYAGIDRDWNASGVAPQASPLEGQRIDIQGFVYWNNFFVNATWHSYSGWEIHPVTAWRPAHQPLTTTISFTPSNPTPGQTIVFNATSSGGTGPYAFTWDFGDGTTATGNPVSHSYGPGTFSIHVAATDSLGTTGVASQTLQVKTVQDFTMSTTPPSLIVPPGKTNTSTITITSLGGFSGTVSLTALVTPQGPSASLSTTTISLAPNGSGSSALTVSASSTTPSGAYSVTVTGTSGSLQRTVQVSVTVPGFTLSAAPTSLVIPAGSSRIDNITLASVGGFRGTVNLSTLSAPAGVKLTLSPTSVTLSSGGTAKAALTVSVPTNSLAGNYTITVKGSGGGTTQTVAIGLTITSDFTISTNPTSLTIVSGTSKTSKVNVKSLGLKGTVTLSASVTPAGLTATISPVSLSFNPGETKSSTLTVTSTTHGNYTVTVVATSGSITHSAQVFVTVTDFDISANPTYLTLAAGSAASSTITLTTIDGFAGTVKLSDTVTPPGLHATLSLTSITLTAGGTGSATLAITSSSTTPPGTYTITVKATSGGLVHTVVIVVTLTAP